MPKEKLYLMEYTFRSGEYEQPACHTLYATSLKDAEKKAHAYLRHYYDSFDHRDGDWYFYWFGEVACELGVVTEITPGELVKQLLI